MVREVCGRVFMVDTPMRAMIALTLFVLSCCAQRRVPTVQTVYVYVVFYTGAVFLGWVADAPVMVQ